MKAELFFYYLLPLRSAGRQQRLKSEDVLSIRHQQENQILVNCFISYCERHPEEVDILFDMLSIFIQPTVTDFTFLQEFYRTKCAIQYAPDNKRKILLYFLRILGVHKINQDLKVQSLQLLVMPMLTHTLKFQFEQKAEIIQAEIIQVFMRDALGVEVCFPFFLLGLPE